MARFNELSAPFEIILYRRKGSEGSEESEGSDKFNLIYNFIV